MDPTTERIVKSLHEASEQKQICRIYLQQEAFPRVIHVYGVCLTLSDKPVLVCWQAKGYTKSGGKAGYRNLILDKIKTVEVLSKNYTKRDDFFPDDTMYKQWLFHI